MELFWEKIRNRLNRLSQPVGNPQGCIVFRGQITREGEGYGIMKVKWPGYETFKVEKAHRMAYMLHNRLTYTMIPRINEKGEPLECSHICHMSICINPTHIVLETHSSNLGRMTCKVHGVCHNGNHSDPPCLLI